MSGQLTQLFAAYRSGDQAAMEAMMPIVYDELRRIARAHLARERPDHTLQATALANEAYLKLTAGSGLKIEDKRHFFALAGRYMRQILVDHARAKYANKRGGRAVRIQFDESAHVGLADNPGLIDLDDALVDLAALDPRQASVVELRFFGGMSVVETAFALDCSEATVKRDWSMAKAWLRRELERSAQ